MKMYMAHPFDTRFNMREWELRIEETYPGFELVNPFYDQIREEVIGIDAGRLERYEFDPAEIVNRDIDLIENVCNYNVLSYVTDAFSIGTVIEMTISRLNKINPHTLTLCVCDNGHHDHPWLKQFNQHVYKSHEDFENFFLKSGMYKDFANAQRKFREDAEQSRVS